MSFNFKRQHQRIGDLLRPIDLQSALLFCNHVLAASREQECDPAIRNFVRALVIPPAPFLIHLSARHVLLQCLGPSQRRMAVGDFGRLLDLVWEAIDHDPAMEDPGWVQSDPTGWAIRYVALQQRSVSIHLQTYGLAAALFTDVVAQGKDEILSIPARIRELLGMDPSVFMRAGLVAGAVRMASGGRAKLAGTITTDLVVSRPSDVGEGVALNWDRFLELASITPANFKQRSRHPGTALLDFQYDIYRFNTLRRFPILATEPGRLVTVDPHLLVARTTLGMYYDGLEADGAQFTEAFGPRFANLVGDLARHACGDRRVWSESMLDPAARAKAPSKNADHAILGDRATVLIECKALKPNTRLLMIGDPRDADELSNRIACAVQQLTEHATAIGCGKWSTRGLLERTCYGIVVTYGHVPTVNGLLFRAKVGKRLDDKRITPIPYIVLSIEEFDCFLRLAELGHHPDDVMLKLSTNDNVAFPGPFQTLLSTDAISDVTRARGERFLATLPSSPE